MGSLEAFASALDRAARRLEDGGARRVADEFGQDFLAEFKRNTPVETGALQGSESMEISGGGSSATVKVSTHLALYASFRNDGGTITVKRARVLTDGASFFGKSVTQHGAHYKEKTVTWAEGAIGGLCDQIVQEILDESGI